MAVDMDTDDEPLLRVASTSCHCYRVERDEKDDPALTITVNYAALYWNVNLLRLQSRLGLTAIAWRLCVRSPRLIGDSTQL
jgi:hypothetical protein